MLLKKYLILMFLLVSLNAGQNTDPVNVFKGLSIVSAGSAISVVVLSGVVGVAVLATPAAMNSISKSVKNDNTNEKLEVSDEVVTAYNYKENK